MADEEDSAVYYDYVSDLQDSEIVGVGKVPATEPTGVEMVDPHIPQDVPQGTNADTDLGLSRNPKTTPTSVKPRATQPSSQPRRRHPKTLHPHAKEWLPVMPG